MNSYTVNNDEDEEKSPPNKRDYMLPLERTTMVKSSVFIIIVSAVTDVIAFLSDYANMKYYNSASSEAFLTLAFLAWVTAQLATAWGMWQMTDFGRRAFIGILGISTVAFLCNLAELAEQGAATVVTTAVFGLAIRGYFIYWLLDNEQEFKY